MAKQRDGYVIEEGNAGIEFPMDDDPALFLPDQPQDEPVPAHCQFAMALYMYGMEHAEQIMNWFQDKLKADQDGPRH